MKELPLNIQNFESLRNADCIYVDKTNIIYQLLKKQKVVYFLSRPRRFGKSLLISTLEAIFQGRKELFADLALSKTDYAWPIHPIIRLDFGLIPHETSQELSTGLCHELLRIARVHGALIKKYKNPSQQLQELVYHLAQENKVVILIDEYDKPILDHINNLSTAAKCQQVLRSFYDSIKALDEYCKFVFVTGVSKFAKTSMFSGFNNLDDLSQHPKAAELLGYTKQEIEDNFGEYLDWAASSMKISHDQLMQEIAQWYDGYRFTLESEFETEPGKRKIIQKIYSPLSVLKFLDRRYFSNYWFETGTPSYLIHMIQGRNLDTSWIDNLNTHETGESVFGSFDLKELPLEALLYQAGYLTIHSFDQKRKIVKLAYPNLELKDSTESYILSIKLAVQEPILRPLLARLDDALAECNLELLQKTITTLFANIPYQIHIKHEHFYHAIFQMILTMAGHKAQSEVSTSKGRIDLVVTTKDRIYLFELKFDKPIKKAIDQIIDRHYYEKYQAEEKQIILIGITFNYENKRVIIDYLTQMLKF